MTDFKDVQDAFFAFFSDSIGVESVSRNSEKILASFNQLYSTGWEIVGRLSHIETLINQNQKETMAKFSEVLQSFETTGASIIDTISAETKEIEDAIAEAVQNAGADEKEFDQVIDSLGALRAKVTDAVKGMVPTMPSPTAPSEPTPSPEPAPTPAPLPPSMPDPEVPVTVTPAPSGTGVEGGSSVDVSV